MKHLVIIGSVWPEPDSSAAGTRMWQLIELFQQDLWQITYASASTPSTHRMDLPARGVAEARISLNCDSFDAWLLEQQPTAVLFDRFMTEEQFGWRVARICPEALRLLDTEDLHSLRAARRQRLKDKQSEIGGNEANRQAVGPVLDSPRQLFEEMATSDIAQRELAAIYRSDLSLMISEFEMALLTDQFGVAPALLHYLPLLVDDRSDDSNGRLQPVQGSFNSAKGHFNPAKGFAEREHFVSLGNFRHPPNWDAVLWLKHQLWPALRARVPGAQLHLYGAYPPPKATALTNTREGFLVKGWAPDARVVISQARVCLAPLRFGAGLKGKLLEAMVCQTPSVTTAIGAEGMSGASPWPGAIADDAPAFVEAAAGLYQDESLWRSAQANAPALLSQRYARTRFSESWYRRLASLLENLEARRRANFVGAMLRHHQHRSTQYMGQWIASKNRRQES